MHKIERKTYDLDATDMSVGRLATKIATILRGKNKPEFEPHIDMGGIVVVKNIDKIKFTGKKLEQKIYYKYSGYPGGLKETKMNKIKENKDGEAEILKRAVRDMLPPVKFRSNMMKRLIIRN